MSSLGLPDVSKRSITDPNSFHTFETREDGQISDVPDLKYLTSLHSHRVICEKANYSPPRRHVFVFSQEHLTEVIPSSVNLLAIVGRG